MVIETIGASVIAILTPYLAEAGKEFAKKAGEDLGGKAAELFQALKGKFAGDSDAEQTLALLETKPESTARQSALQEVLAEKMQVDPDFAATMERLVQEAKQADQRKVIAFGERSVAIGGNATGNTIITGDHNTASGR